MNPALFTVYIAQKRYGAQDGAQDRFYKRNTLSQKALKQRIYAVCAGRSEARPKDTLDFEPTASTISTHRFHTTRK